MPLVLIKEDGSGKADANSYADVADCNAYHDGHLYAFAWLNATTANREKALVFATRLIDAEYQFHGRQANSTQALQWPRLACPGPDAARGLSLASDAVPKAVVQATCEMARELLVADRTGTPLGEGIYLQRSADGTEVIYSRRDRRPIISYLAQSLLAKYGVPVKSRSGTVPLIRA